MKAKKLRELSVCMSMHFFSPSNWYFPFLFCQFEFPGKVMREGEIILLNKNYD